MLHRLAFVKEDIPKQVYLSAAIYRVKRVEGPGGQGEGEQSPLAGVSVHSFTELILTYVSP